MNQGQRETGYLAGGTKIVAHSTICATGVAYRRLNLPNEDRLRGAGIYYGAGVSEASLCENDHVYVVGGGNSAGQASMYFASYGARVSMVIRGDGLNDTLSEYLVDRILASPQIEVLAHKEVTALEGKDSLEVFTITDNEMGQQQRVETKWLFLCLGGVPETNWAAEVGIVRDEAGYLVTGPDLLAHDRYPANWPLDRQPYHLETSMPGLFAAGDVRHNSVKRCASAVGEGAMAVAFVHRYLSNH